MHSRAIKFEREILTNFVFKRFIFNRTPNAKLIITVRNKTIFKINADIF
jgi:hypothetical protein